MIIDRIALILTLVPVFGIDAFLYIMLASNIFTSTINFIWLFKRTHFPVDILNSFLKPVLAGIISAFVGFCVHTTAAPLANIVIKGSVIVIVYVFLIVLSKAVKLKKL